MVGTEVALRLSSAGEALGTQLRAVLVWTCASPFYTLYFSHGRASV